MTEQKRCVRCDRSIDRYARMCVYCSWDQSEPAPAKPEAMAAPAYVPPADNQARNRLLGIIAFIALVIIAFAVGTLIHGFEPTEAKAAGPNKEAAPATASNETTKSHVMLVPVTDSSAAPVVENPITSAPPQAPGQDATDATGLPSDEYASVAAKAKAQRQAETQRVAMIDPRTLRGRAYDEDEPAPRPQRHVEAPPMNVITTEAFPEYRPLPRIHVPQDTAARLSLMVGSDGAVKDIQIIDPVPGATASIIDAVQNWRFRPATINGTPVPAKVAVTITLHANE